MPRLRFPEFREAGEWDNFSLSKISERITDKVGSRKLPTVSITAGHGFVSQAEKFGRDISGQQYRNYIHLKKGQFSYNKGNSKRFPQGCIYQLTEFEQVAAPSAFTSFKFNDAFVPEFFKGYFDSNFHGYQLLKFITSGARSDGLLNISPDDFFSIKLPTPKRKEEQQKIADCLSSLDALIAAQTDNIDALKTHKKGLMQQLFPREGETVPRLRFPEFRGVREWEERSISEIGEVVTGSTPSTSDKSLYGGRVMFVSPADISDQCFVTRTAKTLTEKGLSKARIIPARSTLFVCIGSTIGKIAQNKYECATNQQINSVIPFDNFLNDFVYCALELASERIAEMAGRQAVPIINKSLFSTAILKVPADKGEQKAVADCLSSLDALISAHTEKLDALKTHKKGLMQQLFPNPEAVSI